MLRKKGCNPSPADSGRADPGRTAPRQFPRGARDSRRRPGLEVRVHHGLQGLEPSLPCTDPLQTRSGQVARYIRYRQPAMSCSGGGGERECVDRVVGPVLVLVHREMPSARQEWLLRGVGRGAADVDPPVDDRHVCFWLEGDYRPVGLGPVVPRAAGSPGRRRGTDSSLPAARSRGDSRRAPGRA